MKNYTIRLPEDLREQLQKIADEDGRSLSNMIIYILRKEVDSIERNRE